MEIFKTVPTKKVENFEVTLNYCFVTKVSADPKAGKMKAKATGIFINGVDMCSTPSWVSAESAFEIARECMKGTKWAF